jgi:hypothetical protein
VRINGSLHGILTAQKRVEDMRTVEDRRIKAENRIQGSETVGSD